jgi:hypothetical protein
MLCKPYRCHLREEITFLGDCTAAEFSAANLILLFENSAANLILLFDLYSAM